MATKFVEILSASIKEEINKSYILKYCKCLSIFKLCVEILQPEIEHYNTHNNNTKIWKSSSGLGLEPST